MLINRVFLDFHHFLIWFLACLTASLMNTKWSPSLTTCISSTSAPSLFTTFDAKQPYFFTQISSSSWKVFGNKTSFPATSPKFLRATYNHSNSVFSHANTINHSFRLRWHQNFNICPCAPSFGKLQNHSYYLLQAHVDLFSAIPLTNCHRWCWIDSDSKWHTNFIC